MQTFDAGGIKYIYSPGTSRSARVTPGERFTVSAEDCFTGRFRDPADFTPETAAWVDENLNGVTGPIFVDGARAGQAVEIAIETVEVTHPGLRRRQPLRIALARRLVARRGPCRQPGDRRRRHRPRRRLVGPVAPLIGCLAAAPARETVLSRHEGSYGGNLDCGEITAGATVTLPVEADGASLYFGDCKAAMGDGEVTAAPEVGTRIVATATPVARPASMGTPRVRTDERDDDRLGHLAADAARAAFRQLKLLARGRVGSHLRAGGNHDRHRRRLRDRPGQQPLHTAKCSIDLALLPRHVNGG